jgi:phosphopentomutase
MNGFGGRRALVLVIDACGVGALPDAASYGDEGTNTLAHVASAVGGLQLPMLGALGLGSITAIDGVAPAAMPAIHGRLHPLGPGKDSAVGHWELMGVVLERPMPSYPGGCPPAVLARLTEAMGHRVIGNGPYNGIAAIESFGAEHLRSGDLILYTSQDSVLQLAAHVDRVSPQELYRACAAARAAMVGEFAVGRVIARPFAGIEGAFQRTDGRRDFALRPPGRSYLEELGLAGVPVHAVGKVADLFAGVGIDEAHPGATNALALASTGALLEELEQGLIFVNLIETDQVYGHRKDVHGFHGALREIDLELGRWLGALGPEDLLIVTADHGVDPDHPLTDHTREYAPLLAVSGAMLERRGRAAGAGHEWVTETSAKPGNAGASADPAMAGEERHDGPLADVGATVLRWLTGNDADGLPGRAFIS